ncbi:hypothetical protein KY346_06595 [Candidatus Woesearchaeota archaeon]|nr:hypothetical protein [Candidatus Woesearchaeota archaeon]
MKKILLLFAMISLIIPIVYAPPPGSAFAPGGNITQINISGVIITPHWQGYAGIMTYGVNPTAPTTVNATGSNVTGQGFHLQTICNNPASIVGFILFSNSSANPVGLVPGNLSILDAMIPSTENGSATFTKTSNFNFPSAGIVNNVPTTHTYINSAAQNTTFREGYFNDAAGNIVFATEVNFVPPQGYNTSSFSYQIMVAAPNFTTLPYYIFSDLNVTCPPSPGPGGVGGGGAGRFCVEQWECDEWGPCINGIQKRTCKKTRICPLYSSGYEPPTEMSCGDYTPEKPEYQEEIIEKKISFEDIFNNIELIVPEYLDVIALKPETFGAGVRNNNDISLENMNFQLDFPETMSSFLPIHQFKNVLWDSLGIGWHLRPFKQKKQSWKFKAPQGLRISPHSEYSGDITIMPPAMLPQEVPAALTLLMGERTVKTEFIKIRSAVDGFDAGYDFNPETKLLTLFFIVDNRGKPVKKNTFIEFNLNKGRCTKIAELYGPYNFPANEITILAQEYKMSITGEYELKARLHNMKEENEVNKKCIISG